MAWNVSDDLEICQIAWKVPKCTGQFSNSFNRGRKETIEKVSRWPEKFQMVWTISRWPGMFSDGLEWFRWPGKFPDGLESFQIVWKLSIFYKKLSRFTKTFQVALLPCYLGFPPLILILRRMPYVIKRILHLKQTEKCERNQS